MGVVGLASLPDQRHRRAASDGGELTYARRYALFTLVGIAGEDDLDAPDLGAAPKPDADQRGGSAGQSVNGHALPAAAASAVDDALDLVAAHAAPGKDCPR